MITKRCPNCNTIKSISDFHKYKRGKDGFQDYCKTCKKIIQRIYRKTAKGKVSHHKSNRKYQKTENGKLIIQTAAKRFDVRHPNYGKARHAVNHAIKAGKLPRPDTLQCHYCPAKAEEYHHWHGYAPEHWLDIIPVCTGCHQKCKRKIAG